MKVTREQAAINRERVLDAAARLFRERGFDGIGVAELMNNAGLTHGGFYGQFASKEDLMAQACTRAFEQGLDHWRRVAQRAADDPLTAVAAAYLSRAHRDQPGSGCVLAALGPEASRQGPALRHAISDGTRAVVEMLASLVRGRSEADRRQQALSALSGMVGAVVIARVVDDAAFSREILQSVRAAIAQSGSTSQ